MNIQKPVTTIYGYFNEKYGKIWTEHSEKISSNFGESIESIYLPSNAAVDMPTLIVKKDKAHEVIQFLKNDLKYDFLTDMTATDEMESDENAQYGIRFHLVFHLMNTEFKNRIRIKIKLSENESIPTFINLWPGANWAEREIFDMFGIRFEGHPDLRRILMDMRWEGHPLRKDYPLRGYQVFLTPEPLDPELLK